MDLMSQRFNETGVYLTDEVTDGRPWEALMGGNDDLLSFDAAIIPLSISVYYEKLPSRLIKKMEDNKIFYANVTTWGKKL